MPPRSVPLSWVIVAVAAAAGLYFWQDNDKLKRDPDQLAFWSRSEEQEARAAGFTDPKAWRLEMISREQEAARIESQRPPKQVELPKGASSVGNCRQDISCIGERLALAAGSRCRPDIERHAKFAAEWTDGVLEPKFSRYRWSDAAGGAVTVIGDRLRFQNRFGAWENMIYECDMDPQSERPMTSRVRAGRL